jgi:hypothetical protein
MPRSFVTLALAFSAAWMIACGGQVDWQDEGAVRLSQNAPVRTAAQAGGTGANQRLEVPPPPFSEGIFPCSACHEGMEVDRTRRPLGMHDEIVLQHDEEHRWCLDCHNATDRDALHLASGERVPFEESYRLCGQCHGEKYRDWRAGVHGRRTGDWNGEKKYLLCAHCHDPHRPQFQPIAPLAAPVRPSRADGGSGEEITDGAQRQTPLGDQAAVRLGGDGGGSRLAADRLRPPPPA